jgi:bzd-type benzoyl-CoA reductase N subunit
MTKETILQTFREVIASPRNEFLDRWVESGKKVIGCYCSYIPEEFITAAGMLPYRVRGAGSADTSQADVYLSARLCTFVRHGVNLALEGQFDFLDGVILANTCDHVRRAFDVWKSKVDVPFKAFLSIPRTFEEHVFDWYRDEIAALVKNMEEHFSVTVTDAALRDAVALHNTTRRLLDRLAELRKGPHPPITGTDALTVSVAAHLMPKEEFNPLLDKFLDAIEGGDGMPSYRARLILTGGEFDEPAYLRNIEEQGGLVVAEDVCFGIRHFSGLVEEEGDIRDNILKRYLYHVPCARMVGQFPARVEALMNLVKTYDADGVVFTRMKFCDPWASDAHNLQWRLKDEKVPLLILDREYGVMASGQVKTRVQAFLEKIGK